MTRPYSLDIAVSPVGDQPVPQGLRADGKESPARLAGEAAGAEPGAAGVIGKTWTTIAIPAVTIGRAAAAAWSPPCRMATGTPRGSSPRCARRARVGAEERRAAGRPAPEVGAAVATGAVMFGTLGDHSRLEYTVIGEPVNLAAKLEKHTKEEGVRALCTAEAYRLALAQGYAPAVPAEERLQCRVPGVGTPVDLAVLA